MNKICVVALLSLLSFSSQAAVQAHEVPVVLYKLINNDSELSKIKIDYKISEDCDGLGTYSSENGGDAAFICVAKTDLRFLKNVDELAVILGHELAHIKNKDGYGWTSRAKMCHKNKSNTRQCEKEADLVGQKIASIAGYNGCVASDIFKRSLDIYGEISKNANHPQHKERIKYFQCKGKR